MYYIILIVGNIGSFKKSSRKKQRIYYMHLNIYFNHYVVIL